MPDDGGADAADGRWSARRDVQLLHASSRDVLDRFPGKCGVSWSADGHKLYLARPRSTEVVEVPPLDQPAGQLLRRARELGFTR